MSDAAYRRLPEPHAAAFDVRGWLADLGRCPRDGVQYVSEIEHSGVLTVTYQWPDDIARVRLKRVGERAESGWQLTAEIGDVVEQLFVRAGTRLLWH